MVVRVVRHAAEIAGMREAVALAATLGGTVRTSRRTRGLTLDALAPRVGTSRTRLSEIERGDGTGSPLSLWIALGVALGTPLAVAFSRPLGQERQPSDTGHLEIQEHLLGLAAVTGRHGTFELPTHPNDPARSTDVGLRDDRHRTLIQAECWNTIGDLGAAVRSTKRKQVEAEAHAIATQHDGQDPYRVTSVWVIRASATNRSLLAQYPHIIETSFPGSSRAWVVALTQGGPPPIKPGLVWFDPSTRRLIEHRTARTVDHR